MVHRVEDQSGVPGALEHVRSQIEASGAREVWHDGVEKEVREWRVPTSHVLAAGLTQVVEECLALGDRTAGDDDTRRVVTAAALDGEGERLNELVLETRVGRVRQHRQGGDDEERRKSTRSGGQVGWMMVCLSDTAPS